MSEFMTYWMQLKMVNRQHRYTAYNMRFGASGGVTPQDVSWEHEAHVDRSGHK